MKKCSWSSAPSIGIKECSIKTEPQSVSDFVNNCESSPELILPDDGIEVSSNNAFNSEFSSVIGRNLGKFEIKENLLVSNDVNCQQDYNYYFHRYCLQNMNQFCNYDEQENDKGYGRKEAENEMDLNSSKIFKGGTTMEIAPSVLGRKKGGYVIYKRVFAAEPFLKKYLKIYNRRKRKKCKICQKKFFYNFIYQLHFSRHSGKRCLVCNVCQKIFSFSCFLEKRKKKHLREILFYCRICRKSFKSESGLTDHQRVHQEERRSIERRKGKFPSAEKTFPCQFCQQNFRTKSELRKHKKSHLEEKRFQCGLCDRSFMARTGLQNHQKFHFEERPFKCDHCQRSYSKEISLRNHLKFHFTKPFRCELCRKSFKMKQHLNYHQKCHGRFQCEFCGEVFKLKSLLNKHQKYHYEDRPFQCQLCGRTFKIKGNFAYHMKAHVKHQS